MAKENRWKIEFHFDLNAATTTRHITSICSLVLHWQFSYVNALRALHSHKIPMHRPHWLICGPPYIPIQLTNWPTNKFQFFDISLAASYSVHCKCIFHSRFLYIIANRKPKKKPSDGRCMWVWLTFRDSEWESVLQYCIHSIRSYSPLSAHTVYCCCCCIAIEVKTLCCRTTLLQYFYWFFFLSFSSRNKAWFE